jgi:hypothetical protein
MSLSTSWYPYLSTLTAHIDISGSVRQYFTVLLFSNRGIYSIMQWPSVLQLCPRAVDLPAIHSLPSTRCKAFSGVTYCHLGSHIVCGVREWPEEPSSSRTGKGRVVVGRYTQRQERISLSFCSRQLPGTNMSTVLAMANNQLRGATCKNGRNSRHAYARPHDSIIVTIIFNEKSS